MSDTLRRLDELEMKAAFQEQLLQELNEALINQNNLIEGLERQVKTLGDQLSEASSAPTISPEEPPPHY